MLLDACAITSETSIIWKNIPDIVLCCFWNWQNKRIYSSLLESLKLYQMSHWVKRPDQTSTILESVCRCIGKFKWVTEPSTPLFLLHPTRWEAQLYLETHTHSLSLFLSDVGYIPTTVQDRGQNYESAHSVLVSLAELERVMCCKKTPKL